MRRANRANLSEVRFVFYGPAFRQGALDADVAVLLVDAVRRLGDAELSLAQQFATNFPTPEAAAAAGSPTG